MYNLTKIIEEVNSQITESITSQFSKKWSIKDKVSLLLSVFPIYNRLDLDPTFFISEVYPLHEAYNDDTKYQTIDRTLRKAKEQERKKQQTLIEKVVQAYNDSDKFDNLDYFVNDMIPSTRFDKAAELYYVRKALNYLEEQSTLRLA